LCAQVSFTRITPRAPCIFALTALLASDASCETSLPSLGFVPQDQDDFVLDVDSFVIVVAVRTLGS
jgi:hypothetical protein